MVDVIEEEIQSLSNVTCKEREQSTVNFFLILGLALHNSFNFSDYKQEVLSELFGLLRQQHNNNKKRLTCVKLTLIVVNGAAAGRLKPGEWLSTQSNKHVTQFNSLLEFEVRNQNLSNVLYFDRYALTTNVDSYDGTHFLMGTNWRYAQLLLNGIENYLLDSFK